MANKQHTLAGFTDGWIVDEHLSMAEPQKQLESYG